MKWLLIIQIATARVAGQKPNNNKMSWTPLKTVHQSKGNQMLSENLTADIIKNTHFETADIAQMFKGLSDQGYSAMNLKLVIDLLSKIQTNEVTLD